MDEQVKVHWKSHHTIPLHRRPAAKGELTCSFIHGAEVISQNHA